jgi:hypothetical protein
MNKPSTIAKYLFFIAAITLGGILSTQGQSASAADRSYEATMYVVIGSDDNVQRGELPKSLDQVSSQIRDNFTFRNYRLINTYYGRLANGGSLDYKSVSSLKNVSTELDAPSFLDWQLANFRAETSTPGRNALSVQMFRFGARVPIVVSQLPSGDGKTNQATNYESVGLTLNKLSVDENTPTLVGTISLPKTTGTVFLILTIKQV